MLTEATRDIVRDLSSIDLLVARQGLDLDNFTRIDTDRIHRSAFIPTAWSDGEYVLFRDVDENSRKKFFYCIGAENEARCEWYDGSWALYTCERIASYHDEDELTLAEALAEGIEGE